MNGTNHTLEHEQVLVLVEHLLVLVEQVPGSGLKDLVCFVQVTLAEHGFVQAVVAHQTFHCVTGAAERSVNIRSHRTLPVRSLLLVDSETQELV